MKLATAVAIALAPAVFASAVVYCVIRALVDELAPYADDDDEYDPYADHDDELHERG